MDYQKKGEEELDLVKDDALRVFKRLVSSSSRLNFLLIISTDMYVWWLYASSCL